MHLDAKRRLVLEMIKAEIPFEEIMAGMRLGPLNILWILLESVRQGEVVLRSPQQLEEAERLLACPYHALQSGRRIIDPLSTQLIEELRAPDSAILQLATDGERIVLLTPQRLFPLQQKSERGDNERNSGLMTRRYGHLLTSITEN